MYIAITCLLECHSVMYINTDSDVCVICLEQQLRANCYDAYTCSNTNCQSVYCNQCVQQWTAVSNPRTCAICRTSDTLHLIHSTTVAGHGCGVQQQEFVILFDANREAAERYSNTLAPTLEITPVSLCYLFFVCIGVMCHITTHSVVIVRLRSCFDLVRKNEQQDMCGVAFWIYSWLCCTHGMTALIIVLCRYQQLLFSFGILSILIWAARIIFFCWQLQNNEGETGPWNCLLLASSIMTGFFDLEFYIEHNSA
jgi:hypothetical protein